MKPKCIWVYCSCFPLDSVSTESVFNTLTYLESKVQQCYSHLQLSIRVWLIFLLDITNTIYDPTHIYRSDTKGVKTSVYGA